MRAVCPSTLTEVISSSGEYHSDRRGKLEMSSTPSSPIEIRAKGQLVLMAPNAVGTERRTPTNELLGHHALDANGREEIEHCPRTPAESVILTETTGHKNRSISAEGDYMGAETIPASSPAEARTS